MTDHTLERDIDHGNGRIRKGCEYSTVEAMLKNRLETVRRLSDLLKTQEQDSGAWIKELKEENQRLKRQINNLRKRHTSSGEK